MEDTMVDTLSLLIPILVSAVFVFIMSSIIHMMLRYHRSDFGKVPSEDEVMEALRKFNIPPGDYVIPHAGSPEAMKSAEYKAKAEKGPVAVVTVIKSGIQGMGGSLALWFIYCILVGWVAAIVAGHSLPPGTEYSAVFCAVGYTAFAGYSLALMQNSIWYKRKWSSTIKSMFDGVIYALLTAGTFGWLWPGM
jgi:hypothetical protein